MSQSAAATLFTIRSPWPGCAAELGRSLFEAATDLLTDPPVLAVDDVVYHRQRCWARDRAKVAVCIVAVRLGERDSVGLLRQFAVRSVREGGAATRDRLMSSIKVMGVRPAAIRSIDRIARRGRAVTVPSRSLARQMEYVSY